MATHDIKIVVKAGALSYSDKGGSKVRRGQTVRWICDDHDYGIQFANNASPFNGDVLSLSKTKGNFTDPCTVKDLRPEVTTRDFVFKYTVSVYRLGVDNPIVIDDPVIIVEDAG